MKIRFKRYGRIEDQTRGITPQRLAAAKRALQKERDKLPLLADKIAETQPTPEERINKVDAGLIAQMHEKRNEIADKWREIRAKLRALPEEEREHLLWYWNRSAMPADTGYLGGLLRRWTEQGWRPETRNDEEDQRLWAAGRIKMAVLYERWHKEGRPTGSPVDINAACTWAMQTPAEWRPAILAKMVVEEIQDLGATELARIFTGSAAPTRCIEYAQQLIAAGEITMADVAEAAIPNTQQLPRAIEVPIPGRQPKAPSADQLALW